jgi:hypothetical protein
VSYGVGDQLRREEFGGVGTLFRRVEAVSLDPERSRDFIHRLAKEL